MISPNSGENNHISQHGKGWQPLCLSQMKILHGIQRAATQSIWSFSDILEKQSYKDTEKTSGSQYPVVEREPT